MAGIRVEGDLGPRIGLTVDETRGPVRRALDQMEPGAVDVHDGYAPSFFLSTWPSSLAQGQYSRPAAMAAPPRRSCWRAVAPGPGRPTARQDAAAAIRRNPRREPRS